MSENVKYIRRSLNHGIGTREWLVSHGQQPTLATYGIEAVGWVETGEGYDFRVPLPHFALVFVSVDGVGEVAIEGEWRRCPAGLAYLAPQEGPYAYRRISGQPWSAVWVVMRASSPFALRKAVLLPAEPEPLLHVVQGLYGEDSGRGDPAIVESYSALIVAYLHRIVQGSGRAFAQLRPVWDDVQRRLEHPWTGPELARRAGVSEATLRRLCQREMGRSPLEQVAFLRMRHATALLISTDLPVSAIAARVGYLNPLAFSTAFKRLTGVPPTHYRRRKST
jgi:AraC-like DNA-binding protein